MNKVLQALGQWVCGMRHKVYGPRREHGPWRRGTTERTCKICGHAVEIKRRGPRKGKA